MQSVPDFEPCALLEWDSDFFGLRIAAVTVPPRTSAQFEVIDRWALDHRVRGLYLFVEATDESPDAAIDETPARLAEVAAYTLVEQRVTYRLSTGGATQRIPSMPHPPRAATPADLPVLRALARVSHRNTRFHVDPHFGAERSDAMYEHWIERSCQGWAGQVLVAGPEGGPIGYVTVHADGTIGLMAIRPDRRHQGWGTTLLVAALAWLEGRQVSAAMLRTQSTNDTARRMSLGRGGRLSSTELVFHKWFDVPHV